MIDWLLIIFLTDSGYSRMQMSLSYKREISEYGSNEKVRRPGQLIATDVLSILALYRGALLFLQISAARTHLRHRARGKAFNKEGE